MFKVINKEKLINEIKNSIEVINLTPNKNNFLKGMLKAYKLILFQLENNLFENDIISGKKL